ncbi:prephenate dehydrogenase [Sinisalibacter aestuarii]|uniref:Prephenate/arogenate dehydrogenase domain-containing protein n=1 Tax=Sinisalibacter aestuarii TaxID=2949426 RepID=A0ABQ5LX73_9RHOB|nr:prephenate dehydrogenase [Sinisalibacter aestuarii]GKY89368.1 hypothetical protein STA1M1_32370 [Sinisalibacter aestuarii]
MEQRLTNSKRRLGLIGFGAFGQLAAGALARDFAIVAHDPNPAARMAMHRLAVTPAPLETVAASPIVVIAAPVSAFGQIAAAIAPHLPPGALVCDVGSVKMAPAAILDAALPGHVRIVATHPLFGPQSARDGVAGRKIALCPLRGASARPVERFLARRLGLDVIVTTPEQHDRELAVVQGLTHLVARAITELGPPQTRMTTLSYERLMEAVAMVRDDAPEVFAAIERDNPFAADVRAAFLDRLTVLSAANRDQRRAAGSDCAQSQ